MTGDNRHLIGKGEEGVMDRLDEFSAVASGKIGAAYGASKQGVSGEQQGLFRKIEANAALGVARSVEDRTGQTRNRDLLAVFEAGVRRGHLGGGNAEPSSLNVHHLHQWQIVLVVEDGCSGELLEALRPGNMVDVAVGDDDLLDGKLVLLKRGDDAGDVVAGIDHDGLAGGFVAENGAVALERAYDEDLVDHGI